MLLAVELVLLAYRHVTGSRISVAGGQSVLLAVTSAVLAVIFELLLVTVGHI